MSEDKIDYRNDHSEQGVSHPISQDGKRDNKCGTNSSDKNGNNSFIKWKELTFDKRIELIFTFALVLFTAVLAFTAIYQFSIMRDQMQINNRPWLCSAGVFAQDGFKVGESPTVILKFKNYGNSPARDVSLKYNMNLLVAPIQDNVPMGQYLSKEPSRGVIPPNSEFSSPKYTKSQIVFTKESLGQLTNDEIRLYVFGFIDYLDIFDKRHCTSFCYLSYVEGNQNNLSFKICTTNNKMTDEECSYK